MSTPNSPSILRDPTAELAHREGPTPSATSVAPQSQLDQLPDAGSHGLMREIVMAWPNVIKRPSLRAPEGTIGMFLSAADARGPQEAFLLGTEFAHLHDLPDGALHLVLPPQAQRMAIAKGWALPHPLIGIPTVSRQTLLVFAPRDAGERAVVTDLIRAAEAYARGP